MYTLSTPIRCSWCIVWPQAIDEKIVATIAPGANISIRIITTPSLPLSRSIRWVIVGDHVDVNIIVGMDAAPLWCGVLVHKHW